MIASPQDEEAEVAVLGSVMLFGKVPAAIIDTGLKPEHFYRIAHGDLFRNMLALDAQGKQIDTITLPEAEVHTGAVPRVSNAPEYAKAIVDKARMRDYLRASHTLQEIAHSGDETRLAEVDGLISQSRAPDSAVYDRRRLAEMMLERLKTTGEPPGWTMPFFPVKVRPGTVWLWGGWTSHGKTVWVDQCAREFHRQGAKVWAWLNEMTAEERMIRMASASTGIDLERVESNTLLAAEQDAIFNAMDHIPFEIVEANGWYVEDICRDIRLRKPDVAIIDILHRIPYRDERDLAHISRLIGDTAKLAKCVVFATVHLNEKRVMSAARPQPTLGDIKGASALKQDADAVGMVWREDDETTGRPANAGQIYSLKGRMTKHFGKRVWFEGEHAEFVERQAWHD